MPSPSTYTNPGPKRTCRHPARASRREVAATLLKQHAGRTINQQLDLIAHRPGASKSETERLLALLQVKGVTGDSAIAEARAQAAKWARKDKK